MSLPESAYAALGLSPQTLRLIMNPKPEPSSIASPNLLQDAQTPQATPRLDESLITLYAELLLHIRTVTLFASLRTQHTRETKAKLSTNGCEITITHEDASATIRLPFKAEGGGTAVLDLPATPTGKEITVRLQIEEKEGSDFLGTLLSEERKANVVPWDGVSLQKMEGVEVRCQECGNVIVKNDCIAEWRDLPNENWAEMMDFWHCHKPDEHHLHDDGHERDAGRKGYAAGNRLTASEKLGFVDVSTFLFKQEDCAGAEIVSSDNSRDGTVCCKQCKHILGSKDVSADGWCIWKWCTSISTSLTTSPTAYSVEKWMAARLLFLVENQGVRKFHIYSSFDASEVQDAPSLLIWVFTPDLFYSSSITSPGRIDPTRSMKVFFKHERYALPQPGELESADVESVAFPKELLVQLERSLSQSQRLLPATARTFQGWEVGLLERFDVGDVRVKTPEKEFDGAAKTDV